MSRESEPPQVAVFIDADNILIGALSGGTHAPSLCRCRALGAVAEASPRSRRPVRCCANQAQDCHATPRPHVRLSCAAGTRTLAAECGACGVSCGR